MSRYESLVKTLAYLVANNAYGPVDRMARATDVDMVRTALYEALRYVSTDLRRCSEEAKAGGQLREECVLLRELTGLAIPDEDVRSFLDELEKRGVSVAKRVAVEALTLGLKYGAGRKREGKREQA